MLTAPCSVFEDKEDYAHQASAVVEKTIHHESSEKASTEHV